MKPEEFRNEMIVIREMYPNDPELFHCCADDLLCTLLRELGYGEGIDVFVAAEKWYS